jgi:glycosyltransferase involved in cell wall biosynthesis
LLETLARQSTSGAFTYSIVVADNDAQASAAAIVEGFAASSGVRVAYAVEPRQNIALARNAAFALATGDYLATIDDDEFPEPDWLQRMLLACERFGAAGVLGPVRPHFDAPPPGWVLDGHFCERHEYATGRAMSWSECRTGNVLLRRSILDVAGAAFDAKFGNGGEDQDFFRRMTARGHVFRWCNEAIVHEVVPPERFTRSYMLRRALLRGRNSLKHPTGRGRLIVKSLIAVPGYSLLLPVTLLAGQHVFMKYCIKCFDHAGRLLALAGLNPVQER